MDNEHCRFCGNKLSHTFADLGLSPLSNAYMRPQDVDNGQYFYPLVVKVCEKCFLAQAAVFSKPADIFSDYKYFSSYSKSWLAHCKNYVDNIVGELDLKRESRVTEIACNDGYLLQYFIPYGMQAYGIEPAENVAEIARQKEVDVEVSFFDKDFAKQMLEKRGVSDLIIGNNVFAHVPDINSFVEGLGILLAPKGTITLEFPHLLELMQWNQFDTIYHEHFSYFSILTVDKILKAHKLKLYKIEKLSTHGGSVRIFVTHSANDAVEVDESVNTILAEERSFGLDKMETYEGFGLKIKSIKRDALKMLCDIKEQGKTIAAYGAAAKGNTFLNYCGIGKDFIDYVVDANVHKQGYLLPGSLIPIVDREYIFQTNPDYIVILPWNLKEEIIEQNREISQWGGKFITFIPQATIF